MCGCGCACGRKKRCAGACAAHYDFCAMCVRVRAKKSAHQRFEFLEHCDLFNFSFFARLNSFNSTFWIEF